MPEWLKLAPLVPVVAFTLSVATATERVHVVIPAGPGGGLDGTAREAGRVLVELGLVERMSFENVSGGGGGRAMAYFLENAGRFDAPLLVNSTPLLVRSLQGVFPYGHRDLTPVAGLVADYGVFVVRADDPRANWDAVLDELRSDHRAMTVGGGSTRGSLDHIVLAMALRTADIDPLGIRYLPYDGGGKAMLALLGGEVDLLSTGLGETMAFIDAGEVRALAVTSSRRVPAIADVPTLTELGHSLVFANWRGFFGPPDMPPETLQQHLERLDAIRGSDAWQKVLERRGWDTLNASGADFAAFLDAQEAKLREIMEPLGFVQSSAR
ncbi:MAG: tripartite tricarboxylate transporter substrate binding protein [Gammaproteobacteria bacterium]|nr:tripartite tricarboxylate transporter substrate binding protein [Gammaproteobacteria bacterium]